MRLAGQRISLAEFCAACARPEPIELGETQRQRLDQDRAHVLAHAASDAPIYGLNTGLGANLGHRLERSEIAAFQEQIILGRNTACGPDLPAHVARGVVLARIVSIDNELVGVFIIQRLAIVVVGVVQVWHHHFFQPVKDVCFKPFLK